MEHTYDVHRAYMKYMEHTYDIRILSPPRSNAFRACNLDVPQVCAQSGYLGCQLITDTEGTGSAAGAVVVEQVFASGGQLEGALA